VDEEHAAERTCPPAVPKMVSTDASIIGRSVSFRPSTGDLRALTEAMPNARKTRYGNVNVRTRVGSRSRSSTFIVTDTPDRFSDPTIGRAEAAELAAIQDRYMASHDMVVVDGYIGSKPPHRRPARLIVEADYANLAAKQALLYYDPVAGDTPHSPELTVISTPSLSVPGYKNDRVIAVWLDEGVTRVINTDFFDESKKAALRMWGGHVFDAGGLVLHAGCKVIPTSAGMKPFIIIGLPDSGKTTMTFTSQKGSQVVQDDFVALFADGTIIPPQDGCIEKTFGLDPRWQPAIHHAATNSDAYLENVVQYDDVPDFFREEEGRSGRAVFNFRCIDSFPNDRIPPASCLIVLNRNEDVLPAVTRLDNAGVLRQFLLREMKGWTARDAHGEGSIVGPRQDQSLFGVAQRGARLAELLDSHAIEAYLLNTGRVGGIVSDERSKRIRFEDSFAIVEAPAEGSVTWAAQGDLDGEVAGDVPGIGDVELLQPRRLYERQNRMAEYEERLRLMKLERKVLLSSLPSLEHPITGANDFRRSVG
jgi:phosphoenolpyruvate carboxykinase (ATP)